MGSYNERFFTSQSVAMAARIENEKNERLEDMPIAIVKTNIPKVDRKPKK